MIRRVDKPKEKTKPPDGETKMGRPKMADSDRRDVLIKVLTSEAEYKQMEQAADAMGLGVSTWLRSVGLDKARRG